MGQLIIKYRSQNPGTKRMKIQVDLSRDEKTDIDCLSIDEIVLDDEVFVRKPVKVSKDESDKDEWK